MRAASRMESTGVPGMIQMSASSAALISAANADTNSAFVLTERKDLVHAKVRRSYLGLGIVGYRGLGIVVGYRG